ncbi:hypothetical protein ACPA9J_04125 [Pseudomonas aeruginosa]
MSSSSPTRRARRCFQESLNIGEWVHLRARSAACWFVRRPPERDVAAADPHPRTGRYRGRVLRETSRKPWRILSAPVTGSAGRRRRTRREHSGEPQWTTTRTRSCGCAMWCSTRSRRCSSWTRSPWLPSLGPSSLFWWLYVLVLLFLPLAMMTSRAGHRLPRQRRRLPLGACGFR